MGHLCLSWLEYHRHSWGREILKGSGGMGVCTVKKPVSRCDDVSRSLSSRDRV